MICYLLLTIKFPEIEDENGEKVRVTHSNFSLFLKSKDARVRKDAFEAMYGIYGQYKNTFASTLYGGIKSQKYSMQKQENMNLHYKGHYSKIM